jgi:4-amino-4-deoxy-L-arabinose transferase-like glycosyltransferase
MMRLHVRSHFTEFIILGIIVLIGAAVRVWGLNFGLPYAYHPDESRFVMSGVQMLQTGDFNPGWFYQPSLYTYVVLGGQVLFFLWGVTRGWFTTTADVFKPDYFYMGTLPQPEQYWLTRLLTVAFALLTLFLVYRLTRRLFERRAALIAVALLAISQLHVSSSHFITTDVPLTFFVVLAVWFCWDVYEQGRGRDYILAGLIIGLACSTKYSAYPIVLTLLAAIGGRWWTRRDVSLWLLFIAGLSTAAGFLIGTPYALLDLPNFLNGVAYEVRHNVVLGHTGYEGNTFGWYLARLLGSSERWITLLSLGALILAAVRRQWRVWWLAVFPIAYLLVMGRNLVRFERYLVPMIPFLAMLSGYILSAAIEWLQSRWPKSIGGRVAVSALVIGFVLLVAGDPLINTAIYDRRLSASDVRTLAREWLLANVPRGQTITMEAYGPPLTAAEYALTTVRSLAEVNEPTQLQSGQYVIASSAMYSRYTPDSAEGQAYARMLSGLERVAQLTGPFVGEPDYTIEVYRVP